MVRHYGMINIGFNNINIRLYISIIRSNSTTFNYYLLQKRSWLWRVYDIEERLANKENNLHGENTYQRGYIL
jgi:hypothetical protein